MMSLLLLLLIMSVYWPGISNRAVNFSEDFDRIVANPALGRTDSLRAAFSRDYLLVFRDGGYRPLAGLADWSEVDALPVELACVPPRFFAALRLPVVSYALPALIAIGQARFAKRRPKNPFAWGVRAAAVGKSLRVLEAIQPEGMVSSTA